MKWVRLHNEGDFDVVTAIQMIGASVKHCDSPIGLYGSGIKYAMAQAIRQKISIKIADRGKLYTLTGKIKTFRGEDFVAVCLKSSTGKIHETGITSNFGAEDWTDKWYIFREFYSNMLDEGGRMDIVDGVQMSESGVDVFLPYGVFQNEMQRIDTYFTKDDWEIRPGAGNVYKNGVWIGEMDDCAFDIQSSEIGMTESRTMKTISAHNMCEHLFSRCSDPKLWELLLDSPKFLRHISPMMSYLDENDEVTKAIEGALRNKYGDNYAICPLGNDELLRDAVEVYERNPVCFPTFWTLPPSLTRIKEIAKEYSLRDATDDEQRVIDSALLKLRDFITHDVKIRVCDCDTGAGGYADLTSKIVYIGSKAIAKDIEKKTCRNTLLVLMHEINHIQTNAGDYTREFASGYERYLVELML